ncbi:acyltransferase family protein [Rhizobium leguminosarum]|uniref:acyltransferase family protein n=1 Tax=Rhizobium leguminosarum TaxID=384 RepID=UPI001FE115ED|nr:acyltransferase [Rhizobium leguminosarum]
MDKVVTSQSVRGGSRDRVRGIDGLRAICLILVLQAHWGPSATFEKIAEWGRAGLLVFFVISGFLITRILIDLSARRQVLGVSALLINFYSRRFFRIQPIYYIALAFIICMGLNDAVREDVIYHILFLQNFSNVFLREDLGVYGPAYPWWSLAVEGQFYVFWAPVDFSPTERLEGGFGWGDSACDRLARFRLVRRSRAG